MKKRGEKRDRGGIPSLREQKNTFPSKRKRKRKIPAEPNPLPVFLRQSPDDNQSRLWEVAQRAIAAPVDLHQLETDLIAKLKRLSYPQPDDFPLTTQEPAPSSRTGSVQKYVIKPRPDQRKKTFYECLEVSGAESVLLCPPMLKELGKCLLLRTIIEEDRKLEQGTISVERHPIAFHKRMMTLLASHEGAIESAQRKYNVDHPWMSEYLSRVAREYWRQARACYLSRYPGSRKELLGDT